MNNALEVKNLSKKQGDFELKNISFELPKGMILGFIGENGAGKTTTMKAILNIIKKDSGTIKILGKEKNFEEEVGIVLDDSFFPEILTPHDINKIMKSMYKTWDEKMYEKYLKEFNLPKKKEMKAFSKGMRKKLEIITAIAHHPKLLLLDEPTQGLDPIARNEVIKLLQEFIETGENSVLLSSHITTDLEHLADYIIFINKGEVILDKTIDEILEQFGIAKCSQEELEKIEKKDCMKIYKKKYECEILVENKKEFQKKYKGITMDKISLDDLMLLMIKGEK